MMERVSVVLVNVFSGLSLKLNSQFIMKQTTCIYFC
jgi:hypothetical protein